MKLHIVSLGCARNLVDSEVMTGRLAAAGCRMTDAPERADAIIVNTCSFIESAADESIDAILEMARFKKEGRCRRLVVTGCLPERYREQIADALPEVDCFLGTGAFGDIVDVVTSDPAPSVCRLPDPDRHRVLADGESPRVLSTPHAAYLKIAEGCSRHCTYCIIPKLRGRQKSRTPAAVVAEAEKLIRAGVKELTLVAQDTTFYGRDLSPAASLDGLLEQLAALSPEVWIRLLYGHPESIDEKMMRTVARHSNICSYFDIPIQHGSDPVLKRMGRNHTVDTLLRLFDRIRTRVPDAALRTTVIVGFPGETDADFRQLLSLVGRVRFDHLGVFTYSDADDLPAHRLPDHVPAKTAEKRREELMLLQQDVSEAINRGHVGKTVNVLLEESVEKEALVVGRTPFQAPEVDGVTYVKSAGAGPLPNPGTIVPVTITEAYTYDLVGDVS